MVMVGFAANVSAEEPAVYDLETWTGSGTVSQKINTDYTKVGKIYYSSEGKEVDSSNYTITGDDKTATITFKEEYLKTLKNGKYKLFSSYYSDEKILSNKIWLIEMKERTEVTIPSGENGEIAKIMNKEEVVDSVNYTVTEDGDDRKIIFNEEYLETLGEDHKLEVFFFRDSNDFLFYLMLDIDVKDTSSSESSSSTISSEESSSTASTGVSSDTQSIISQSNSDNGNPKTGENNYGLVTSASILIMLFAVACAVVLIIAKNKKEYQR